MVIPMKYAMCKLMSNITEHMVFTLLKIKVVYWHLWFHEEPLTLMESFHSTKRSL